MDKRAQGLRRGACTEVFALLGASLKSHAVFHVGGGENKGGEPRPSLQQQVGGGANSKRLVVLQECAFDSKNT